MANDERFTVDRDWAPVQLAGQDLTDGVFSVFAISPNPIGLIKSDTLPDQAELGVCFLRRQNDSFKYDLGKNEKLFSKSTRGPIEIGVIPA